MKRLLLSLIVAGGLALMAAPSARAAGCQQLAGHSYAIGLSGAEVNYGATPSLGANPPPIAGIGVIQVGAAPGCVVTGELIYDDNDTTQAPAQCTPGGTVLKFIPPNPPGVVPVVGKVPCFDGSPSHITGTASENSAYEGTLSITASFGACQDINGEVPGTGTCAITPITLNFDIFQGLGGSTFTGVTIADPTQATQPPVLAINGQKQGTTGTTTIANISYGMPPWSGATTINAGAGMATSDSILDPGTASVDTGFTVIDNPSGIGGGSLVFNGNNDFLDVTSQALPGIDCHYAVSLDSTGSGPFTDGTANTNGSINQPYTGACAYANIGAAFAVSTVLWGATNNQSYGMTVSDEAAITAMPGTYGSGSGAAYGSSSPALSLAPGEPAIVVDVTPGLHVQSLLFRNASPVDCVMDLTLVPSGPSNLATVCSISQPASALNDQPGLAGGLSLIVSGTAPPTYAVDVYPGYQSTDSGAVMLTCTSKPTNGTTPPVSGVINVFSPNCPALNSTNISVHN